VAWRWLFGAPALALLYWQGARIVGAAPLAGTGIYDASLTDPLRVVVAASEAARMLLPPVLHTALWLAPLLLAGWAVASAVGRNLVLRRYDGTLPFRPRQLIALQLLRAMALTVSFGGWFAAMSWAARLALGGADAPGLDGSVGPGPELNNEPNLVFYFALAICLSLGAFTLWALLSWVFSIAPLLALAEGRSTGASLLQSLRLGRPTARMVEVNLVLGIVKLALIVLAMVFSATPLPFEGVVGGTPLYLWWAGVTLVYFAASDFFQVARLVAFLEMPRSAAGAGGPRIEAIMQAADDT